jgi:hypothetical protein
MSRSVGVISPELDCVEALTVEAVVVALTRWVAVAAIGRVGRTAAILHGNLARSAADLNGSGDDRLTRRAAHQPARPLRTVLARRATAVAAAVLVLRAAVIATALLRLAVAALLTAAGLVVVAAVVFVAAMLLLAATLAVAA